MDPEEPEEDAEEEGDPLRLPTTREPLPHRRAREREPATWTFFRAVTEPLPAVAAEFVGVWRRGRELFRRRPRHVRPGDETRFADSADVRVVGDSPAAGLAVFFPDAAPGPAVCASGRTGDEEGAAGFTVHFWTRGEWGW